MSFRLVNMVWGDSLRQILLMAAVPYCLAGFIGTAHASLDESVECNAGGTILGDKSCSKTSAQGTTSALATSSAQYGILKSSATSSRISLLDGVTRAAANSRAFFSDSLTINSPGLTGQVGYISVALDARWGSVLVYPRQAGTVGASARFGFDVIGARTNTLTSRSQNQAVTVSSNSISVTDDLTRVIDRVTMESDGPLSATWSFLFGDSFVIRGSLNTSASTFVDGSASVNASNSAYWDGITYVQHMGQNVEYSVASASGTDWTRSMIPIPEPSAAWLLLVGLFGVHGAVRFRLRELFS